MRKRVLLSVLLGLLMLPALLIAEGANESAALESAETYPYTLISCVTESNPRVAAIAVDFGKDIPINWELANAFKVNAELLPVTSYTGDLIANSGVKKAPRNIIRAYTSDVPEISSPKTGRYVIIEMNPMDNNASSYYIGFNPGIRQLIPYGDNMKYEVELLYDLNYLSPNPSRETPASEVEHISKYSRFEQDGSFVATGKNFEQKLYEMPENEQVKFLGYNIYKPRDVEAGEKVPLVVFLHGSGQSHDYVNKADEPLADVLSPLYASQGGTTWIENMKEKCYVLVPQCPLRDIQDEEGQSGWRVKDTQKMLINLVDEIIAENSAIDTDRLYLTGLSMGAFGSWRIITNPDPAVSQKFAAAAVIAGSDGVANIYRPGGDKTPLEHFDAFSGVFQAANVQIPLWILHADTDPVVSSLGSREPFAILTDSAISADGKLMANGDVSVMKDAMTEEYIGVNRYSGKELRYTEYLYGDGSNFRELGMVTRNGHFSWEIVYKDQNVLDWMFSQSR